jgi:hypothetical protein
MPEDKKVPNPFGRKGGLEHQAKVNEVAEEIQSRGLQAVKEQILRFLGIGKYRFADVAAVDNREIVEVHQIGKETMSGNPVKREQIVMDEIEREMDISVSFHAYNKEKKNE